MIVIGVDPGITGAIALFNSEKHTVEVFDTPVAGGEIDYTGLASLMDFRFTLADFAYIEKVHAMPKQGVSSTFKFGTTLGAVMMAVAMCNVPRILVSPTEWKMRMGLNNDKSKSLKRAIELFPKSADSFKLKKHDGRAEAALLAWYGYRMQSFGRV